jgi:hypothetical protein
MTPLPMLVLVGVPVESVTATLTSVPAQTGMRWAVQEPFAKPQSPIGSTMFPVIWWTTFALLAALWPFPIV